MITLTLLHPIKNTPVQSWTFDNEPVIRMGRATDNHVVLYSAVVSRRHVELHRTNSGWDVVNLGANGTFIDGERVNQIPAVDGLIIRLARSGPSIQVGIDAAVPAAAMPAQPAPSLEAYGAPAEVYPEPEVASPVFEAAPQPQYVDNGRGTIYDVSPSPNAEAGSNFARQTIINEEADPAEPDYAQPPVDASANPFAVGFQPQTSDFASASPAGYSPQYDAPESSATDHFPPPLAGFEPAGPVSFDPVEQPQVAAEQGVVELSAPPSLEYSPDAGEAAVRAKPQEPELEQFSLTGALFQSSGPEADEPDLSMFNAPALDLQDLPPSEGSSSASEETAPGNIIRFSLETGQPLQVQQSIGRYQVVKTIVQSNHNITYLAWRDGRSMALKTLNANWSDYAQACAVLEEEAKIFHNLRHPGLPQLIDFFWVDGQPFLAREMIYGKNLEQYVASHGPIPAAQALGWLIQVCDALNYLHQQNPVLLHHDLKPRNIIRRATPQGSWEISLVGLQLSSSLTEVGTQMGFPSYTAPEQQEGNASTLSDLYSLGPILVYLLTGQEPELFYRYVDNEYRLVADEVPGLVEPVVKLIQGLTALRPEERIPTAKDVSRMIQQILNAQSSMGTRL